MGAAVAVRRVHVPEPRQSGVVAAVYDRAISCTLAAALDASGVSLAALADAAGVSKSRVAQWADPTHEAEPNLSHLRRMPRSVRRAVGLALVESADADTPPTPEARWVGVALSLTARVAGLTARLETARAGGPLAREDAVALLRELAAVREEVARLEAGVRASGGQR
jgi:transcriptional regulator with XRE-family HTH domain